MIEEEHQVLRRIQKNLKGINALFQFFIDRMQILGHVDEILADRRVSYESSSIKFHDGKVNGILPWQQVGMDRVL